jgi:hypothetical protein
MDAGVRGFLHQHPKVFSYQQHKGEWSMIFFHNIKKSKEGRKEGRRKEEMKKGRKEGEEKNGKPFFSYN